MSQQTTASEVVMSCSACDLDRRGNDEIRAEITAGLASLFPFTLCRGFFILWLAQQYEIPAAIVWDKDTSLCFLPLSPKRLLDVFASPSSLPCCRELSVVLMQKHLHQAYATT